MQSTFLHFDREYKFLANTEFSPCSLHEYDQEPLARSHFPELPCLRLQARALHILHSETKMFIPFISSKMAMRHNVIQIYRSYYVTCSAWSRQPWVQQCSLTYIIKRKTLGFPQENFKVYCYLLTFYSNSRGKNDTNQTKIMLKLSDQTGSSMRASCLAKKQFDLIQLLLTQ